MAPSSSLDEWPSTGGVLAEVYSSTNTLKASATNVKITGINPDSLTSVSITHDSSLPTVGSTGANVTFSLTPKNPIPTSGSIAIQIPL